MKKKRSLLLILAVVVAMTFGLAVNALAAGGDGYLKTLAVYEDGSNSGSMVDIADNMVISVGANCSNITLNAVCEEGYGAYYNDGSVKVPLDSKTFNLNGAVKEFRFFVEDNETKTQQKEYKLKVYKNDTSLKSVKITYGDGSNTITKTAVKSGDAYNISVPETVTEVALAVEANSNAAVVQYGDSVKDNKIDLSSINKVVTNIYVYPNADSDDYKVYTLNITKTTTPVATDTADLKSLTANYGKFDKTISGSTTTYKLSVPYGNSTTTITAAAKYDDAKAIINTNSSAVAADFASATKTASKTTATLTRGNTVKYYVHILAADGVTVKTYTINVYRSNSSSEDEARLKTLSVKYGSSTRDLMPSFDYDVKDYYLCLPKSEDEIKIYATAKDSDATIKVDGSTLSSSYKTVSLGTGSETIAVTVKSANGANTETYEIHVYRSSKTSSSNADISSLKVKTGKSSSSLSVASLNKNFDTDEYTYNVDVASTDKYFAVNWDPEESYSVAYLIYGDKVVELDQDRYTSAIKITSDKYFTIRAYSPDCKTHHDYKFYVDGESLSNNAYLLSLAVKANGNAATLSPIFSKTTTNYTVVVAATATYVNITPVASDSKATITVNDETVKSGSASANIKLTGDSTRISIVVKAEDGSTYRYYVTVNKNTGNNNNPGENPGVEPTPNLKMVFKLNDVKYTVNNTGKTLLAAPYLDTKNNRTLVPIRAIAEAMGATVDYNGTSKLITIKLDGKTLTMTLGKEIVVGSNNYGAPGLKNGTTFVPVRYIGEQLGAKVEWVNTTKSVIVSK